MPSISFFTLGLLIGSLIGLSSDSIAKNAVVALFAIIGGSIIVFLNKLTSDDRKLAFNLVLSLSIGGIISTYSAIIISEYQLLSPRNGLNGLYQEDKLCDERLKYLRASIVSPVDAVDQLYRSGIITIDVAYKKVLDKIHTSNNDQDR